MLILTSQFTSVLSVTSLDGLSQQAQTLTQETEFAALSHSFRYVCTTVLPGGNSDTVPPDSISNSEVKRISGDGSVGVPM
jgi:hypothetical protein